MSEITQCFITSEPVSKAVFQKFTQLNKENDELKGALGIKIHEKAVLSAEVKRYKYNNKMTSNEHEECREHYRTCKDDDCQRCEDAIAWGFVYACSECSAPIRPEFETVSDAEDQPICSTCDDELEGGEETESPCPRCGKLFLYPSFSHSTVGSLSYYSEKCMGGGGS